MKKRKSKPPRRSKRYRALDKIGRRFLGKIRSLDRQKEGLLDMIRIIDSKRREARAALNALRAAAR